MRWALAAAGGVLLALGLAWTFSDELFGVDSVGLIGTPVVPYQGANPDALAACWIGLVLLLQWLFLRPRGSWALRDADDARPMAAAALGAGFCAMLLTFGLIAALMEAGDRWIDAAHGEEAFRPWVYVAIGALWIVWTLVFATYARSRSRILRGLIGGTIAELLVAAPVHALAYKREDCYCARGSYTALVFGGTALLWVFGPGVYLLYRRERARRAHLLRRCPHCGADLSGSAAETCPHCGGAAPLPGTAE